MKTSCGEEEEGMNQSENEPNSAMVVVESLTSSRQLYYVGTTAAVDDKLFR